MSGDYPGTYYVVFGGAEHGMPWWQRIFVRGRAKDFGHVEVVMQLGCDVMRVMMNCEGVWFEKFFDLDVPGGFVDAREVALAYAAKGHAVVEIPAAANRRAFHIANVVPSCVTMVKAVLGRATWEITPWQLYQGLIRDGGVAMSFGDVPKPDTSALEKQQADAQARQQELAQQRQKEFLARRRGLRGRRSLITNLGGESGGGLGNG